MPVIKCALKYLRMDLIIHPKWTPSASISWLLLCISLLLFTALMVIKRKKKFHLLSSLKKNAFHIIPQSGAFKSETDIVHTSPYQATKGG